MKKCFSICLMALLFLTGCTMGPSKDDVKTAIRDAVQQNTVLGMLKGVVNVDHLDVDKIEKKDNGVYEATVTIGSSANIAGVKVGGTVQTPLRLKNVDGKWVLLQ